MLTGRARLHAGPVTHFTTYLGLFSQQPPSTVTAVFDRVVHGCAQTMFITEASDTLKLFITKPSDTPERPDAAKLIKQCMPLKRGSQVQGRGPATCPTGPSSPGARRSRSRPAARTTRPGAQSSRSSTRGRCPSGSPSQAGPRARCCATCAAPALGAKRARGARHRTRRRRQEQTRFQCSTHACLWQHEHVAPCRQVRPLPETLRDTVRAAGRHAAPGLGAPACYSSTAMPQRQPCM